MVAWGLDFCRGSSLALATVTSRLEFCSSRAGSRAAALSLGGNTLPWRFLISARANVPDPRGRDKLRVLGRGLCSSSIIGVGYMGRIT